MPCLTCIDGICSSRCLNQNKEIRVNTDHNKATRALAGTAINIINYAGSNAKGYTEADAIAADIDLLQAHIDSGRMDEAAQARAVNTMRQLSKGKRRY